MKLDMKASYTGLSMWILEQDKVHLLREMVKAFYPEMVNFQSPSNASALDYQVTDVQYGMCIK